MATKSPRKNSSIGRENTTSSRLGGLAPINSPAQQEPVEHDDQKDPEETNGSHPNIYTVQPFKHNRSLAIGIEHKKSAPNPGEDLLNSTIELINHFTICYESVKQQLQEEKQSHEQHQTKNESMIVGTKHPKPFNQNRVVKQARLRPLIVHEDQENHQYRLFEDSIGNSSKSPVTNNELSRIYESKLRLLRKLKPQLFDSYGNLLSHQNSSTHSLIQSSSQKSTTSSVQPSTNHYSTFQKENYPTFMTEVRKKEEQEDEEKCVSLVSIDQANSINEMIKDNYIVKVIDIKTSRSKSHPIIK